ncbi:hypothetical protein ABIB68_004728 [Bradyrhizobium sp. F1.2.2]
MGEGGSPGSGETGEGYLSAREPAAVEIRGNNPSSGASRHLLPQGEKEESERYFAFLALAFFAFFTGFSLGAFFSTFTATGVLAAIRIDRA